MREINYFLPVLSLIVAALAVFVGPLISWFVSKQQSKNSLRIANKQVIAPIRQNWINELRVLLSELTGKSAHYWAAGFEDRNDDEYRHITELESKLALYINVNENDHVELLKSVKQMVSALGSGSLEQDREFWGSHAKTVSLSQKILKREWERVKNEI
ncbi:hypothetical protein [Vibrio lentus]|nr:hypothetical protein [Vibrio lentus]PMG59767.1 hypothetical protein BCU89_26230 [Vibrio splendidus]PMH03512.1 hypothetical protein BCU78_00025 [Vibrio lentus]